MEEYVRIDARDGLQERGQCRLRAEWMPVRGEKDNVGRGDKLLEGPATPVPPASAKRRPRTSDVVGGRNIGEVDVTDTCLAVPFIHGVERLDELCTAGFVDAAGVHPEKFESVTVCDSTCVFDLGRYSWVG